MHIGELEKEDYLYCPSEPRKTDTVMKSFLIRHLDLHIPQIASLNTSMHLFPYIRLDISRRFRTVRSVDEATRYDKESLIRLDPGVQWSSFNLSQYMYFHTAGVTDLRGHRSVLV